MDVLFLLAVCVWITQTPGEAVLTVRLINKTLPSISMPQLLTFTFLRCEIEADFDLGIIIESVESRWRLPNGTFIKLNECSIEKYVVQQGTVGGAYESLLLIQHLIYSDANDMYMCEVRDVRDPDNRGPWMAFRVALQLLVELTVDERNATTSDDETDVSLSCEMSLYLRPDEDLQWFRGDQLIADNTERYTITYTNGTDGMGQFGGDTTRPSRISTLVISEPQTSDSDTYTCAIRDTEHSQDIQLTVKSAGRPNPPTVQPSSTSSDQVTVQTSSDMGDRSSSRTTSSKPTDTMSPFATGSTIQLPIIIGGIAGVLGIIVIVLIVIICFLLTHNRKVTTSRNTAYGVNPYQEPEGSEQHYYDYIITTTEPGPTGIYSTSVKSEERLSMIQQTNSADSRRIVQTAPQTASDDISCTQINCAYGVTTASQGFDSHMAPHNDCSFTQINCAYGVTTADESAPSYSTVDGSIELKQQSLNSYGASDDGSFTKINCAYGALAFGVEFPC